jgi:hypothetical protein
VAFSIPFRDRVPSPPDAGAFNGGHKIIEHWSTVREKRKFKDSDRHMTSLSAGA